MKTVYNTDQNGVYTYESKAGIDPLEPTKFTLMLNQVETKPLPTKEGYAVRHNAESCRWEYVEDHRGTVVFDVITGEEITIDAVGPIDGYATAPKPTRLHTWDGESWSITAEDEATLAADELAERQVLVEGEIAAKKEEALAQIKMFEITLKHFPDDAEASADLEKWELHLIKLDKYQFGTRVPMPSTPRLRGLND